MYNNEVLSIVAGYVSIASWIVVLFPQIWTNFKRKSSDSISLTFLYIWAVGDLLNLTGAILQHLLETMIFLAVYYIFTDIVVISQVYYYRRRSVDEIVYSTVGETTPLISNNNSTPESRRQARIKQFWYIFFSLIGVCLTGVIAYVISNDKSHEAVNFNLRALNESDKEMKLLPQIFGWASAILYLGSRIPQILQNYKNKTTEGLALAMFCFSVLGNISYSLSIIFHSTDPEYLLVNLAWLIGSGGTLVFDFVIFAQFYIYRNNSYIKPNSTTHNQTTGNV